MDNREAIELLKGVAVYADTEYKKALTLAIAALEFREHYNEFWADVKSPGMKRKKIEIHHGDRIFSLREVAQ